MVLVRPRIKKFIFKGVVTHNQIPNGSDSDQKVSVYLIFSSSVL